LLRDVTRPEEVHDVRYTLSGVYSAAHYWPKAEEQLRLILEADPNDATACNDLGYIMADRGVKLEEAETLIRKALRLDEEQKKAQAQADGDQPNAAYVDSLGWVLFRRGRFAEARREMERAVALPEGGSDPVVWQHLGDVCFRSGEVGRAREAWRRAVTLYETEKRRKMDDQYRELKTKLRLTEPKGAKQAAAIEDRGG
jgi:Flp pilus assembly protein TadD